MNTKIAVILGLALWLLPSGQLLAEIDNTRLDAVATKAEQARQTVRSMQMKIDDLQVKISRLESKINSRDYRLDGLETKLRGQDILERRVKALEDTWEDFKAPTQTTTLSGKTSA